MRRRAGVRRTTTGIGEPEPPVLSRDHSTPTCCIKGLTLVFESRSARPQTMRAWFVAGRQTNGPTTVPTKPLGRSTSTAGGLSLTRPGQSFTCRCAIRATGRKTGVPGRSGERTALTGMNWPLSEFTSGRHVPALANAKNAGERSVGGDTSREKPVLLSAAG